MTGLSTTVSTLEQSERTRQQIDTRCKGKRSIKSDVYPQHPPHQKKEWDLVLGSDQQRELRHLLPRWSKAKGTTVSGWPVWTNQGFNPSFLPRYHQTLISQWWQQRSKEPQRTDSQFGETKADTPGSTGAWVVHQQPTQQSRSIDGERISRKGNPWGNRSVMYSELG